LDATIRRLDELRRDEESLSGNIVQKREQLKNIETAFDEAKKNLAVNETRLAEFLNSGPRVLSLSQAIAELETRHRETSKSIGQAAEQELALQVKHNSLTESNKKEAQRAEQFRMETVIEEEKLRRVVEKTRDETEGARKQLMEKLQHEEVELSARVKSRVSELQEKHEMLRHTLALGADETTVIMFANDLIKRIDLIDILIKRYSAQGTGGGVEQQLATLRASFEDILAQHGIHEFFVDSSTEVSTDLRARISVVENISGKAKAKVVECFRPGFIYKTHGGREVILRKVEVKTSSA
jgi:chromosome segregation ATPase